MRAYLLHRVDSGPYIAFGEDVTKAAEALAAEIGGDSESFSVSGSWKFDEIIDLGKLWPFFTNNPPLHMIGP